VKPANILIDKDGNPYLADFGLALHEDDVERPGGLVGTLAYMSPEQARREGHLVDGRSDIFSLGVVFYEMLTGTRPFRGSQFDLLEQIQSLEARPPRQRDPAIHPELERICLKALAKRSVDRYLTAGDMAQDIQRFLTQDTVSISRDQPPGDSFVSYFGDLRIVPRGLSSFDASDASFFLQLLPGPRDRDGVPETLRFWKNRIHIEPIASPFRVGLLYGPSGCGKSSFIKAGLIPRLDDGVRVVYVEATSSETESRLLTKLRPLASGAHDATTLADVLLEIRRNGPPSGRKVLLVLDQFEQWLHGRDYDATTELVRALRQCDGTQLQAMILVRDDFWMAVTRFMRALEIRLIEGENSLGADLFDTRHARKVLSLYGAAFGNLPATVEQQTDAEQQFVRQAIDSLAHDGKVISVQVALFAEMARRFDNWVPATLDQVGGTEGLGVEFLEGKFSSRSAPPEHHRHEVAARKLLSALLPEAGTEIKGAMRPESELLQASGYDGQSEEFESLLRILVSDVRLVTPTDPPAASAEQTAGRPDRDKQARSAGRYFQLTHDYLVPSLRTWLTRKQQETRRGRAQLRLAERAAMWDVRRETQQLPSLWEWTEALRYTSASERTSLESQTLTAATRLHMRRALSWLTAGVLVSVAIVAAWLNSEESQNRRAAQATVQRLVDADIAQVPQIVSELDELRPWTGPLLDERFTTAADDTREKLHVALALPSELIERQSFLSKRLLTVSPTQFPVVRDSLQGHSVELTEQLWKTATGGSSPDQQFRATCALATYAPQDSRWDTIGPIAARGLSLTGSVDVGRWIDALRPVSSRLIQPLREIAMNRELRDSQRMLATEVLAEYVKSGTEVAELIMLAEPQQFEILFSRLVEFSEDAVPIFRAVVRTPLESEPDSEPENREQLALRQAHAAVALARLGLEQDIWGLLKLRRDPRSRSYLLHAFREFHVDPRIIWDRYIQETDVTVRRALILALGEYGDQSLEASLLSAIVDHLQVVFREETDQGIHSAAEWALKQYEATELLGPVVNELTQSYSADRPGFDAEGNAREWYINSLKMTMLVVQADQPFHMGSPAFEEDCNADVETLHLRRIGRTFAIAATPVTVRQFKAFRPDHEYNKGYARDENCPVNSVNWYSAAEWCNWLSEQEGIPSEEWCYPPDQRFESGMKLYPDYLSRRGYRLPTEAEWEYACRAGTATARCYGQTEALLAKYAWYTENAQDRFTLPVGSLKPNDFGLFDVHGNIDEWCQDQFQPGYPARNDGVPTPDVEDLSPVVDDFKRLLRGGSFGARRLYVRSANRYKNFPQENSYFYGFRPVRTLAAKR
ncbi:MAG: SUMF1/EgtB/PvdO family nonheme iron enzyme, partial [Planctomycetota bacterium]